MNTLIAAAASVILVLIIDSDEANQIKIRQWVYEGPEAMEHCETDLKKFNSVRFYMECIEPDKALMENDAQLIDIN